MFKYPGKPIAYLGIFGITREQNRDGTWTETRHHPGLLKRPKPRFVIRAKDRIYETSDEVD